MNKQEEKTKRTYSKILYAAIEEFGSNTYDTASINTICSKYHIPKGLIYHNFKNKEELYLRCVEVCFQTMREYFEKADPPSEDVQKSLKGLLRRRENFFRQNPYYRHIFFQALFQPPKQLAEKIRELRKSLDEFHQQYYQGLLKHLNLRDGITEQTAMKYFLNYQEMFNLFFQYQASENKTFPELIQIHESQLFEILDIMLYGVAKQTESVSA